MDRLRLIILKYIQNNTFKNSKGVIFLTKYASEKIQKSCGPLDHITIIPHGVDEIFRTKTLAPDLDGAPQIRALYISNALPYKHHCEVIEAISELRKIGLDISIDLVGGGTGAAQFRLKNKINELDPKKAFIRQHPFVQKTKLPEFLSKSHLFVFASSCENMPNTLVEAMASGLPIACSSRGPMPEVLKDTGQYFNPEKSASIITAIKNILENPKKSRIQAKKAQKLASQYSWERCADETLNFLKMTNIMIEIQSKGR